MSDMTAIERYRELANDRRDEFPTERDSALEAEKPAEDARSLAIDISLGALDRAEFWEVIVPKRIHSFAESYHAKKCAECKKKRAPYRPFGTDQLPEERP